MDLTAISDAFVVVVVGGMGSIVGSYVAAVLIAEVKALCIGIGLVSFGAFSVNFSKLTLVAEFLVMAVVLIARPHGLLGRPQITVRGTAEPDAPIRPASNALKLSAFILLLVLTALPLLARSSPYTLVLGVDVLIAVLFATSLHFIMGPAGCIHSAMPPISGSAPTGAALAVKWFAAPMGVALAAAPGGGSDRRSPLRLVRCAACGCLPRNAYARLRSDRLVDHFSMAGDHRRLEWRSRHLAERPLRWIIGLFSSDSRARCRQRPIAAAYSVRAVWLYDARRARFPLRAEAIGIDVKMVHWLAFAIAGTVCGVAGGIFAFAKGSISPETISIGRSVDGLVMVLLGGIQTLSGPIVGASVFAVLQDMVMRQTEYWHALLGGIIIVLVLAFPAGLAGAGLRLAARWRRS